MEDEIMKAAYLIEALGTFFLILTIALSGNPLAIGGVLAILVYIGAEISGAHYNPAVTLALFLQKKINQTDTGRYVLSQFIGGISASLAASLIFNKSLTVSPPTSTPWSTAFVAEVLFTTLLILVIFLVAVNKKTRGNQYFGFAIGATLFIGASTIGNISGGALNPAVAISPLLVNTITGSSLFQPPMFFLYTLSGLLAAALASFIYEKLNKDN